MSFNPTLHAAGDKMSALVVSAVQVSDSLPAFSHSAAAYFWHGPALAASPAEPDAAGAVERWCFGLLQPAATASASNPAPIRRFFDRNMTWSFPLRRVNSDPEQRRVVAASRRSVTARTRNRGVDSRARPTNG